MFGIVPGVTADGPPTSPSTDQPYAAPNPRAEAQRLLEEGQGLLDQALRALRGEGSAASTAELVGRASDRVGSALYFLRMATRG